MAAISVIKVILPRVRNPGVRVMPPMAAAMEPRLWKDQGHNRKDSGLHALLTAPLSPTQTFFNIKLGINSCPSCIQWPQSSSVSTPHLFQPTGLTLVRADQQVIWPCLPVSMRGAPGTAPPQPTVYPLLWSVPGLLSWPLPSVLLIRVTWTNIFTLMYFSSACKNWSIYMGTELCEG